MLFVPFFLLCWDQRMVTFDVNFVEGPSTKYPTLEFSGSNNHTLYGC